MSRRYQLRTSEVRDLASGPATPVQHIAARILHCRKRGILNEKNHVQLSIPKRHDNEGAGTYLTRAIAAQNKRRKRSAGRGRSTHTNRRGIRDEQRAIQHELERSGWDWC